MQLLSIFPVHPHFKSFVKFNPQSSASLSLTNPLYILPLSALYLFLVNLLWILLFEFKNLFISNLFSSLFFLLLLLFISISILLFSIFKLLLHKSLFRLSSISIFNKFFCLIPVIVLWGFNDVEILLTVPSSGIWVI